MFSLGWWICWKVVRFRKLRFSWTFSACLAVDWKIFIGSQLNLKLIISIKPITIAAAIWNRVWHAYYSSDIISTLSLFNVLFAFFSINPYKQQKHEHKAEYGLKGNLKVRKHSLRFTSPLTRNNFQLLKAVVLKFSRLWYTFCNNKKISVHILFAKDNCLLWLKSTRNLSVPLKAALKMAIKNYQLTSKRVE